jgi:hypothetical protein
MSHLTFRVDDRVDDSNAVGQGMPCASPYHGQSGEFELECAFSANCFAAVRNFSPGAITLSGVKHVPFNSYAPPELA